MKILVSIIIPVYNSAHYIRDTIISCLQQTFTDTEIIIVNDGSTDNSATIISKIKDSRIKYFEIPNHGVCYARNYGISKAQGTLFQFLDADDILGERKLDLQVKQYKKYGDDYVYTGEMGLIINNEFGLENNFEFYYQNLSPQKYFEVMFGHFGKYLTTGLWLVPKKLMEQTHGWDEKILINNDGEYFSRIVMVSKGLIFCPKSIFYYRRDVSSSVGKRVKTKSEAVYRSWLYSYICYVKHFQETFAKKTANRLGRRALSVYYCNSYPNFPDLLRDCREQIRRLGYRAPAAHGGKMFKILSSVIGVDAALRIRTKKGK